jgi:hypothetical protein
MHSAKALPSAALGKAHKAKKKSVGKAFVECPTLGKVQNKKKSRKNSNFFLPWRPPPASARPFLYLFLPIPLFVSVAFSFGFFFVIQFLCFRFIRHF